MTDLNDELKEWNDAIAEGEKLRSDIRRRIIRMRESWMRRRLVGLLRYVDRWIAKCRRWRNESIQSMGEE